MLANQLMNVFYPFANYIENFIKEKDKSEPILIYCYHGNSSQPAANFFSQQGFKHVYSMDEGYAGWTKEPN